MSIILALIIFSVVVIIHELGHFLLAKKNGIAVTEFSVGMGPRILSTVRGDTRYSLKLFPIGGSCMMLGEDEDNSEQNSFRSKSVGARISVIAAGPIFNFVLAYVLAVIIMGTIGFDQPVITTVEQGSLAAEAGLMEGDVIQKFNGKSIHLGREMAFIAQVKGVPDTDNTMVVLRDGEKVELTFDATIRERIMLGLEYYADEYPAEIGNVVEGGAVEAAGLVTGDVITAINGDPIASGLELSEYLTDYDVAGADRGIELTYTHNGKEKTVSVTPQMTTVKSLGFNYNLGRVSAKPLEVLKYSFYEVKYVITSTYESLAMLVTGRFGLNDLSGPVGIVNMIGDTYEKTKQEGAGIVIVNLLNMMILISANLGVMNLLPLPALDGGRLVFLVIEGIRRKPISPNKEGMVHFVGLVLLMILMVVVMFNDVLKLF